MNSNFNLPDGVSARDISHADDTCLECDGSGLSQPLISNCCGFQLSHWPDSDICPHCKEHCEPAECENCGGSGIVEPKTKAELAEEKDDLERN